MENAIAFYQTCIKELLSDYLSLSTRETEVKVSFDDERMCYLVMRVGWHRKHTRIHRCLIHVEIERDTVIIQANNTEDELLPELVQMGIPRDRIRIGCIPDEFLAYAEQRPHRKQRRESGEMYPALPAEQVQDQPQLAPHA